MVATCARQFGGGEFYVLRALLPIHTGRAARMKIKAFCGIVQTPHFHQRTATTAGQRRHQRMEAVPGGHVDSAIEHGERFVVTTEIAIVQTRVVEHAHLAQMIPERFERSERYGVVPESNLVIAATRMHDTHRKPCGSDTAQIVGARKGGERFLQRVERLREPPQ